MVQVCGTDADIFSGYSWRLLAWRLRRFRTETCQLRQACPLVCSLLNFERVEILREQSARQRGSIICTLPRLSRISEYRLL